MPLGEFILRDDATDVHGIVHPAGAVTGWANVDPNGFDGWGVAPGWLVPGLITLWRPNGITPAGARGNAFAKTAVNLAQVLVAQIGATSQFFAVRDAREVDIVVPVGAKIRYRIGVPSERAARNGVEPTSTQIVGSGSAVEVPLKAGEVLHLVADATQATPVAAEMRFVLFHPD